MAFHLDTIDIVVQQLPHSKISKIMLELRMISKNHIDQNKTLNILRMAEAQHTELFPHLQLV